MPIPQFRIHMICIKRILIVRSEPTSEWVNQVLSGVIISFFAIWVIHSTDSNPKDQNMDETTEGHIKGNGELNEILL